MDPVGYETTVVTFYVRGTLIFPWWTEVSTSSLFLRALREANDPRAWEQLKILRSLTDALDLGYLKRAREKKKGADNFNGGRIWRDSLPNMDGKGKISWTGSTWLAVELFSIWSSIIFQYFSNNNSKISDFHLWSMFHVSLSQNLLLYIDTSNVWVCMFGVVVWDMILSRSRDPWILDVPMGPFGSRTTPTYGGPLNKSLACICYR